LSVPAQLKEDFCFAAAAGSWNFQPPLALHRVRDINDNNEKTFLNQSHYRHEAKK